MPRVALEFEGELTTFAVDQQRRTVSGLIVPWGEVARSAGKLWGFARGGLKTGDLRRIKLLRDHDNSQVLGYCLSITETEQGIEGTFSVAPGPEGDRALALAEHGTLDGLSMGAEWTEDAAVPYPGRPGAYLVQTYSMKETSLTGMPAFESSRLTSVRATEDTEETGMPDQPKDTAPAQPAVTTPPATTAPAAAPNAAPNTASNAAPTVAPAPVAASFSKDDVLQLLAAFNRPATPETAAPAAASEPRPVIDPTTQEPPTEAVFVKEPLPYRFSYSPKSGAQPGGKHVFHKDQKYDFSSDLFSYIDSNGSDQEAGKRVNALIRAAFDVDQADVVGVTPATQRPDLWQPQMDYATPLWDMISAGTTDGRPFILPKFNTSSGLVSAATEGTEPAPGAFTVTTQTVTPTQVWGKVEITRQAIRQGGNPQISGIVWEQMLREYYEDREAAVATFLNTLTSATDIALTTPTGAADNDEDQVTVGELEAAIANLMFVRGGNRFSAFAVHQNLFRVLARVKDDSGRPLYPMINPQNANGTTNRLFKTIDFAGTTAVPAWALGAASTDTSNSWLFDPAKVLGWANAPERLDWNFGATVQTANIPQLSHVTMGIYGDLALANLDIAGVRQVTFDPTGS